MTAVSFSCIVLEYFQTMKNLNYLIEKYNKPIPRYTSFPPVPFWHDRPNQSTWLNHVVTSYNEGSGVDVYVHIPFCEQLCYYCGCNRIITKNHDGEEGFVKTLLQEWDIYKQSFQGKKIKVNSIHFGGGTPNFLSAANLEKLINGICEHKTESYFGSIEIDPRTVNVEQLETLLKLGVTRFSLGIQDFDKDVQAAINRVQTKEMIQEIVTYLRKNGVESINFDLIYGLPKQSLETIRNTFEIVADLNPDMIAFYSYAHLPDKIKNQKLIKAEDLPGAQLKRELYNLGKQILENSSFVEIGMDHFAKNDNFLVSSMKEKKLKRSFMGYTDRRSNICIALGPTAISETEHSFIQNDKNVNSYTDAVEKGELAITNGSTNTAMDRLSGQIIQELMCQFSISKKMVLEYSRHYPVDFNEFIQDEIMEESEDNFHVTKMGRAFVRNIANKFDFYAHGEHKVKFSQSI